MDYYLHTDSGNQGPFPLDTLRRRRQTGELRGDEFVWRAGMTDWQSLDSVLQQNATPVRNPLPPPIPASQRPSNQGTNWGVVGAYSLFALVMVAGAIMGFTHRTSFLPFPVPAVRPVVNPAVLEDKQLEAMRAASKPVTWTTNTQTEADWRKRDLEFRRRQWVTAYEEYGDHGAECDAQAVQLIRAWQERAYGFDAHTNLPDTSQLAESLATNPACTDPLVLTAIGVNCPGSREKARRLELALNGFQQSKYNAYARLFATLALAAVVANDTNRVAALDASALPMFREALADGSFTAADQEECAETFINDWGKGFFSRNGPAVAGIARDAGSSFEWLALVLEGRDHVNEAWKARGHDYASKVTPQGWEGFRVNLAAARTAFSRACRLDASRPLAASEMIEVSLGDSGITEMRSWFDRAVAARIDYPQAWSAMRNGLRPRWFGSLEAMRAFGVTAVNTSRFDTGAPAEFMDIVREIEADQEEPRTGAIYGRPDIWPEVQRVCQGYLASPQSPSSPEAWHGTYAVAAYLAGQYQVARSQLDALNWSVAAEQRAGWGADLSLMNQEVAAYTGANATTVAEAETARNQGDLARALKIYNQLLAEPRIGPRVRRFASCRVASLKIESRLQSGEWVDFMPDPSEDRTWVFEPGKPAVPTNGVIEVDGIPGGHLFYSRVRVGRNFEVKGDFEFVNSSAGEFQIGLVMGMPDFDSSRGDFDWYAFRVFQSAKGAQLATFSLAWSTESYSRPALLLAGTNTFDFRFQGGRCSASVNGEEVFTDQKAPAPIKSSENGFLLGLGAYHGWHETVRYENIQVRKIPPENP